MKKSRLTETQIITILKEADAGMKVDDIFRKHSITNTTYYAWKSRYGRMDASEVKCMKALEGENARLKKLFADVSPENHAIKELFAKKKLVTADKIKCASILNDAGMSIIKSCILIGLRRSCFYRVKRDWRKSDAAVLDAINLVLKKSPQSGFRKCFQRIRLAGQRFNHKRVYRVYCRMGLNMKRRVKRVLPKRQKQPLNVIERPNYQWALDFMHDTLYCGKQYRTLNILDEGTR